MNTFEQRLNEALGLNEAELFTYNVSIKSKDGREWTTGFQTRESNPRVAVSQYASALANRIGKTVEVNLIHENITFVAEPGKPAVEITKAAFEHRLNKALIENAKLRHGGMTYGLSGLQSDGSRAVLGPGDQVVGSIRPDGTVDIRGMGDDDEEQRPKIPRVKGWDVSWDTQSKSAISQIGTDTYKTGSRRSNKFFPITDDLPECGQCGGSGIAPGTQVQDVKGGKEVWSKGKPCSMCYGVGKYNKRMTQFVQALAANGRGPKVRMQRGTPKTPTAAL
jgi:hypothetical protein